MKLTSLYGSDGLTQLRAERLDCVQVIAHGAREVHEKVEIERVACPWGHSYSEVLRLTCRGVCVSEGWGMKRR